MTDHNGEHGPSAVERVRAAGMLHSLTPPGYQPALALAIGDAMFAGGRLAGLSTCTVCGVLGDEGDECGRPPNGHRLTTVRLTHIGSSAEVDQ